MLFCTPLMGVTCSPTEAECGAAGCDDSSEYPACISLCVPRLDASVAAGAPCALDPCLIDSMPSLNLCPSGFRCESNDPTDPAETIGTCQATTATWLFGCNPADAQNGQTGCATGTFCVGFDDIADESLRCDVPRPPHIAFDEGDGFCSLPRPEGRECDSDWGERGCATCEAGTVCAPDPRTPSRRICQRPCDPTQLDPSKIGCPCEGGTPVDCRNVGPAGPGDEGGLCDICINNQIECDFRAPDPGKDAYCDANPLDSGCQEWIADRPFACCDDQSECTFVNDRFADLPPGPSGAPNYMCCHEDGDTCDSESDCCIGSACLGGVCDRCDGPGEPAGNCCPRLEARDGICQVPCDVTVGAPCGTPAPGCGPSAWVCTPEGGPRCRASGPDGDEETCNDVDDDCDGRTDEGLGSDDCTGPYVDSSGPRCKGRAWPGTKRCRNGVEGSCEIETRDFCGFDAAGDLIGRVNNCEDNRGGLCPSTGNPSFDNTWCGAFERCDVSMTGECSTAISPSEQCGLCTPLLTCGDDVCWGLDEYEWADPRIDGVGRGAGRDLPHGCPP